MEDNINTNSNSIEALLLKATEYGKTSYELVKLKILDKTADIVSTALPRSLVYILLGSFILFSSLGLAFWLGEIFGKLFLGFFAVAAFYFIVAFIIYFFFYKWLKRKSSNYFINHILK